MKSEVVSLDELVSQLLTQESRNEKFNKATIIELVLANLTKTTNSKSQSHGPNSQNHNYTDDTRNNQFPKSDPNFGGRNGQFRGYGDRFGGRFRGRGDRFGGRFYDQCQICSKIGHDGSYCHYCFSAPHYDYYGPYSSPRGYGCRTCHVLNILDSFLGLLHSLRLGNREVKLPKPSELAQIHTIHSTMSGTLTQVLLIMSPMMHPTSWIPYLFQVLIRSILEMDKVWLLPLLVPYNLLLLYILKLILKLNNLLLVPSITKNIVSVSQFAKDNNVYFEFHPNHCFFKSRDSSKVLLIGILGHDGPYQFEHNNSSKTTAPVSQNSSVNIVCNKVPVQTDNSASFHLGPSAGFNFNNFQCNNVEHLPSSSTSDIILVFHHLNRILYVVLHFHQILLKKN